MNHTRDARPFYLYIVRYAYEEKETGFYSRWKGMLVFGFLFLRLALKLRHKRSSISLRDFGLRIVGRRLSIFYNSKVDQCVL